MPILPLLADPAVYRPCIQDLLADGEVVREYWLSLFERHLDTLGSLPVGERRLRDQPPWPAFARDYLSGLADLRHDPARRGRLSVLELTRYREERFIAHGIVDPFADVKHRETSLALAELPRVLAEIDAMPPPQRWELLVRNLLAGNLFDFGSPAAIDAFRRPAAGIRPRPWPIDDFDQWVPRLESLPSAKRPSQFEAAPCCQRRAEEPPALDGRRRSAPRTASYRGSATCYAQALFFVDNSGPDIVLGAIPLARELARRGTRVVLAANSRPALNDVTAAELHNVLDACRLIDAYLAALLQDDRIAVVESGCHAPLIDLADLTPQCCAAAAESDLLILEGMGRAIESNYDARFTVDTVKVALIKDQMVADLLGVQLFDPAFRFEPAL
jgi:uncharacterized protein with ATP-grasp and redox domains